MGTLDSALVSVLLAIEVVLNPSPVITRLNLAISLLSWDSRLV